MSRANDEHFCNICQTRIRHPKTFIAHMAQHHRVAEANAVQAGGPSGGVGDSGEANAGAGRVEEAGVGEVTGGEVTTGEATVGDALVGEVTVGEATGEEAGEEDAEGEIDDEYGRGASSSSAASTTLPPFNHLFGAASTTLPAFGRDILLSSAADATLPAPGRNIHHHSAASSTLPPLTHHPLPPPPSHDTFNAASATFHAADSGSTAAGGASGNDGLNAAPTDASNSWLQDSSAEPAMDEAAINEAAAYFRGYQDGYQQRGMEAGVSRVGWGGAYQSA
ncbi:hypothetical protein BDZ90DRAFT_257327 [Jaminaea rosea]|uniref:Uncharacterized protein n=1 Tax=Jaminaea rosea TaxID=1569628 RepID=A0A316UY62_9BASI|nr:hypothetical protein BDZ90DRAFT_257327 [Jaminaea rosea]PWN30240.1 hypothetical protein BDZ90DRAFT_257327 [Jaminaea rosea]